MGEEQDGDKRREQRCSPGPLHAPRSSAKDEPPHSRPRSSHAPASWKKRDGRLRQDWGHCGHRRRGPHWREKANNKKDSDSANNSVDVE